LARRYKTGRIKVHRSYEIEEAAETVGVTPQTIRAWIGQGLPALTEKRPYLILGWQLKAYLKSREAERKAPMAKDEFYCLRCKARRKAALGLTERATLADGRPILTGFCAVCETECRRFLPPDAA
jgi:hypothetical protein